MFKFKSKFSNEEIDGSFETSEYRNGNLAVVLNGSVDGYFEPWATLSVNVPEVSLGEGEFVAKTYSENEGLVEQMVELGFMEPTGKFVKVGYANNCPIMRLTPKVQEHLS